MAESTCAVCGQRWYPHEPKTNRMVAQAAHLPEIGLSMWRAIWPGISASDCWICGGSLAFRANETGADWVLSCPVGHVMRQAEHKPGGAPAQWSSATAADYQRAVREGLIVPDIDWQGFPQPLHDQIHSWTDQCGRCEEVKETGSGMFQLTMPQVVRYSLDNRIPCTLVTDRGDATAVYVHSYASLQRDFTITAPAAPVRTTSNVLNSLAGSLRQFSLNDDQQSLICDIATRLWWRLPWDQVRSVYAPARALVEPVAYHCAWDHPGMGMDS